MIGMDWVGVTCYAYIGMERRARDTGTDLIQFSFSKFHLFLMPPDPHYSNVISNGLLWCKWLGDRMNVGLCM
jgi:hypothetical protein